MNYIYDIYLNFNKNLFDFFDWNKNDKYTHIKMIPIFKIKEEDIKKIITNTIKLNKEELDLIYKKTTTCDKNKKQKNCCLFCDKNNVIAIEFDDAGLSINKSYLFISDELEILENFYKIKEKELKFKIIEKNKNILKTRKQIKDDNFIIEELKNIDNKKLNYVYFECFGRYEKEKSIILNKLLNISKQSKVYKNLYNILKLTATSTK